MPLARIITRFADESHVLVESLRARGFQVQTHSPSEVLRGMEPADLEITLDQCAPDYALQRATDGSGGDVCVFIAPGVIAGYLEPLAVIPFIRGRTGAESLSVQQLPLAVEDRETRPSLGVGPVEGAPEIGGVVAGGPPPMQEPAQVPSIAISDLEIPAQSRQYGPSMATRPIPPQGPEPVSNAALEAQPQPETFVESRDLAYASEIAAQQEAEDTSNAGAFESQLETADGESAMTAEAEFIAPRGCEDSHTSWNDSNPTSEVYGASDSDASVGSEPEPTSSLLNAAEVEPEAAQEFRAGSSDENVASGEPSFLSISPDDASAQNVSPEDEVNDELGVSVPAFEDKWPRAAANLSASVSEPEMELAIQQSAATASEREGVAPEEPGYLPVPGTNKSAWAEASDEVPPWGTVAEEVPPQDSEPGYAVISEVPDESTIATEDVSSDILDWRSASPEQPQEEALSRAQVEVPLEATADHGSRWIQDSASLLRSTLLKVSAFLSARLRAAGFHQNNRMLFWRAVTLAAAVVIAVLLLDLSVHRFSPLPANLEPKPEAPLPSTQAAPFAAPTQPQVKTKAKSRARTKAPLPAPAVNKPVSAAPLAQSSAAEGDEPSVASGTPGNATAPLDLTGRKAFRDSASGNDDIAKDTVVRYGNGLPTAPPSQVHNKPQPK